MEKVGITVACCIATASAVVTILHLRQNNKIHKLSKEFKEYHGSCHCNAVQFSAVAPKHLVVWDCNCSICKMKKNWHFIIPASSLKLLSG